jgi:ribonuclease HI
MENEQTNRKQTGCAFVVYQDGTICHREPARLNDECSVFQAELFAIKNAVIWCLENDGTAIINSDSESSLKAIANRTNRNKFAVEIRELLRRHSGHICLKWVKAHVGIEGNEEADKLAKEATCLETVSYNKLPLSFALRKMSEETFSRWNQRWQRTTKGRTTSLFFPTIEDRRKCSNVPNFVMTQFMSGHGKFHKYLTKVTIEHDPRCHCGPAEQTPIHLIKDCPAFAQQRLVFESRINEITNSNQISLNLYCTDKCYNEFHKFVTKIYNQLPLPRG